MAFLAVLLLVQGVLLIALSAFAPLLPAGRPLPSALVRLLVAASFGTLLPEVAQLVLGFATLAAVAGIVQLRPWAWHMAMALQGVLLVILLLEYFSGDRNYLNMLLAAIIALYLNWRPIRQAFEIAQHRAGIPQSIPVRREAPPSTSGPNRTMPVAPLGRGEV